MKRKGLVILIVLSLSSMPYFQAEARYYDSRTGRFLAVDPQARDFPATSPYVYTLDNPLKYTDPDGKAPILAPVAGIGAGVYIGGAVTIAVVGHTWNYTFNPAYRRAVDQGSTDLMHIAGEALGKAADDVKGVWEAGTSLITNALNSENSQQTGEPVQGGEQLKGASEADREIDVKERATPGADGATSQIIKETSDGETISITHQVKKGDQTIHQHQTHVGKSGAKREFPESWREHKTINDQDSGGAAQ